MIRLAGALLLGALASASSAFAQTLDVPAGTYKLDPTHASVTWRVVHLGLSNYTARFTKFDATLVIDPAKPEAAKLSAVVDPTSVRTDYPNPATINFDKEIATGDKWLNANVHKTITFTSTEVKPGPGNTAKVTGNLTLLGVTKPITLDVKLNGGLKEHPFSKKAALGFSATGTVKRSQFGMTAMIGPVVSDDVQLQIEAEMIAQ
jgi:polyisoprenoid-binding protein YceI